MITPDYISFEDWIANLAVDFPQQNVPIDYREDDWRNFVTGLISNSTFSDIPQPDYFSDWRDWAYRFYELNE